MSEQPDALAQAVHDLLTLLPRFDHSSGRNDIPINGLYFFFEREEFWQVGDRQVDRIVRVGTHRVDGRAHPCPLPLYRQSTR